MRRPATTTTLRVAQRFCGADAGSSQRRDCAGDQCDEGQEEHRGAQTEARGLDQASQADAQVLPQLAEELDSAFAGPCGLVFALSGFGNLADIAESAPCLRTRRSRVQALLDEFLGAYEYKGCKAPPRRVRVIECTGVMVPRVE